MDYGQITAKKPLLKDTNKKKRFAWAKKQEPQTLDRWKLVPRSVESKCAIFGANLPPRSIEEGVRWCFAGDIVSDSFRIQGTLNQHGYHSILQQYAITSGLRLVPLSFVFQQDNDPTHTSRLCKGYLTKESDECCIR